MSGSLRMALAATVALSIPAGLAAQTRPAGLSAQSDPLIEFDHYHTLAEIGGVSRGGSRSP